MFVIVIVLTFRRDAKFCVSTVSAFRHKHKKNRELHLFVPEVLQYLYHK